MVARAPGAPIYGSAAFLALSDGPERVASVVRAAEAWATEGEQIEVLLAEQVEALRRAYAAGVAEGYRRRVDDHRGDVQRMARHEPDPRLAAEVEADFRTWARGAA